MGDAVTVALGVPDKVTDPVGRLVVISVPLVVIGDVVVSPVTTGMVEFDVMGVSVGLVIGGLVVTGPVVMSVGARAGRRVDLVFTRTSRPGTLEAVSSWARQISTEIGCSEN